MFDVKTQLLWWVGWSVKYDRTGDHMLSKVVNVAISTLLLYEGILKPLARRTLINTVPYTRCPSVSYSGNIAACLRGLEMIVTCAPPIIV